MADHHKTNRPQNSAKNRANFKTTIFFFSSRHLCFFLIFFCKIQWNTSFVCSIRKLLMLWLRWVLCCCLSRKRRKRPAKGIVITEDGVSTKFALFYPCNATPFNKASESCWFGQTSRHCSNNARCQSWSTWSQCMKRRWQLEKKLRGFWLSGLWWNAVIFYSLNFICRKQCFQHFVWTLLNIKPWGKENQWMQNERDCNTAVDLAHSSQVPKNSSELDVATPPESTLIRRQPQDAFSVLQSPWIFKNGNSLPE